jgi:hypothetical protein
MTAMKIRKLLVGLCCVAAITLTASSASAITINLNDLNLHGTVLNPGAGNSDLDGTWDLTVDPEWITYISPATSLAGWTIDSAQVSIVITNDAGSDTVQFLLNSILFLTDANAADGLDWVQTWTSNVGLGSGTLFGSISDDGMLSYRVHRTNGNFTVDSAQLTVLATNPLISEAVPDGGTTLTMLGLGMVGLGALRRKFLA